MKPDPQHTFGHTELVCGSAHVVGPLGDSCEIRDGNELTSGQQVRATLLGKAERVSRFKADPASEIVSQGMLDLVRQDA